MTDLRKRLREKRGNKIVDQYLRHGELMAEKVKQVRADRAAGGLSLSEETYASHLNDDALRDYIVRYGELPQK